MKNLEYAFRSYIGSQDRECGDSFTHDDGLFMVVDGFGIDSLTETVKEETCQIVPRAFYKHLSENKNPADALVFAVEEANKKVIEERHKLGEKIAASIGLIYFLDKIMYFTHLGDSRIYSFQAGELNQLTKDHTVKEEDPLAEKKYNNPRALNALTHGLGIHEKPVVQVKKYPVDKRCLIILTTSGLTERVSNRDIAWLSRKVKKPEKIIRALINLDKRKGGSANLTVGIIKCGGLTKMLRNRLMTYSVFFLILAAALTGFVMRSGSGDQVVETLPEEQPAVQDKTVKVDKPAETTPVKEVHKVIVQPIIKDNPQEKTAFEVENQVSIPQQVIEEKSAKGQSHEMDQDTFGADYQGEVRSFISEWVNAWEKTAGAKGDIAGYINFYSDRFSAEGFNKGTWRVDKEAKNKRKSWITLKAGNIKISNPTKDGHIEASFKLTYRSSNFSGSSKKTLDIVKEGGSLKIISERTY